MQFTVFITGAIVMISEITASRILAPFFGTTIISWTSIIGVILSSLSIGYYLGGKAADAKRNSKQFLSVILLISAIFLAISATTKEILLFSIQKLSIDIKIATIAAACILFAPVNIAFGSVVPLSTRVLIRTIKTSGTVIGKLYAVSTVGSIIGTFLAGFYLLPYLGNTTIFIVSAFICCFLSLFLSRTYFGWLKILILFILGGLFLFLLDFKRFSAGAGFIDIDSQYSRIWVFEFTPKGSNRPRRYLMTDLYGNQAAMYLDNPEELVFQPLKFFRMAEYFQPSISSALMIGGGGYSFVHDYLKRYRNSSIDIVEIDPRMTEVAQKYFNLSANERLTIIHEDGRIFLNNNKKKYNVIYVDAFSGLLPPFQLVTQEAAKLMSDSLTANGIVLIDIISALEGKKSPLLSSIQKTFSSVFPHVYTFPVFSISYRETPQNIIIVAAKEKNPSGITKSASEEISGYMQNIWTGQYKYVEILTDDFAPIEYFTLPASSKTGTSPIDFFYLYKSYFRQFLSI